MTSTPSHRVILFALDADGSHVWDENDRAVVRCTVELDDLADARRLHRETILQSGSFSAAALSVAVEAFAENDLSGYLAALNTKARLAEEFPEEGTWISALTEDPAHWAEIGVTTPAHLAAYLDGCFEREMEKAALSA